MKRRAHVFYAVAAAVVLAAAAAAAAGGAKRHRVVFELNVEGAEQWQGALNNVENLRQAFGREHTEVEVVAHGKGLGMLLKTNEGMRGRLARLAEGGVLFAACENTMRRMNVKREDLLPFVVTVDSGVAEVVRKQEAGWSYLKAGS